MVESSPTPMSGSRGFPSLVEESPSLGAYPNPPSGSRLNPTIIQESPTQIEEDESDRWFLLVLEYGSDDEEEEIGVLEGRAFHHSPISVASSPAVPEPMSGTRNRPMLVEDSPAPQCIILEDSLAPQYIVVEESPVPMSGVKDSLCLGVKSLEPTEDRGGTTSPMPLCRLLLVLPRLIQSWVLHVFVCSCLLVHGLVLVTSSLHLLRLLLFAAPLLLLGLVPLAAPPHPRVLVHLCASLHLLGLVLILVSLLLCFATPIAVKPGKLIGKQRLSAGKSRRRDIQ